MIELLVTAAGLSLADAEYLWVRAYTAADTVELVIGSAWQSHRQHTEQWVYFGAAKCVASTPGQPRCDASRASLALAPGVPYDLVAWTLAADRRDPQRELLVGARRWLYDPADIDLDGSVGCADLERLSDAPYDWNLDGVAGEEDLAGVRQLVGRARADVNGDGSVTETDLELLTHSWGACEPEADCRADLDCDGTVGMSDLLLVLDIIGGA